MEALTPRDIVLEHMDYFINSVDDADEDLMKFLENDTESSSSSSDDSDDSEKSKKRSCRKIISIIDSCNNSEFRQLMAVNKQTALHLIEKFKGSRLSSLRNTRLGIKIEAKRMIYIYIWFMSNTANYEQLCDFFGITMQTALKYISKAVSWLNSIAHEYIKWPTGTALESTCKKFFLCSRIPGVIGVINATHITIKAGTIKFAKPGQDVKTDPNVYIFQTVVDADNKFIDIYCRMNGALNNRSNLAKSQLGKKTEDKAVLDQLFPNSSFLLADHTYPCKSWLVPQFARSINLNQKQKNFNDLLDNTRKMVNNTFWDMKERFPRLSKVDREQQNAHLIIELIRSACVLHNICLINEDILVNEDRHEKQSCLFQPHDIGHRRDIIMKYFMQKNLI